MTTLLTRVIARINVPNPSTHAFQIPDSRFDGGAHCGAPNENELRRRWRERARIAMDVFS
jgi:hypothetical protein